MTTAAPIGLDRRQREQRILTLADDIVSLRIDRMSGDDGWTHAHQLRLEQLEGEYWGRIIDGIGDDALRSRWAEHS